MNTLAQLEVCLNEPKEFQKNVDKSKKLKRDKIKRKKCEKKLLYYGLPSAAFISVFLFIFIFKLKDKNKQLSDRINKPNIYTIKMPFAINIDNNANLSKRFEEGFNDFPLKRLNVIDTNNYNKTLFFDNLELLNISKWINIEKEKIREDNINNFKNNNNENFFIKKDNKLYVLISYVVQTENIYISNTTQIELKKNYLDRFKEIANLKDEKEKEKGIKNIINEIGLYIPTKIILGGRIDISFEINKEDKEIIILNRDKFFNPPNNLSKIIKNYSCECLGGKFDYCKNKNITKWQESVNNNNSQIIRYIELYNIYNYLDDDIIIYFIKNAKKHFPEGIYYGKIINKRRNGYGRLEYNDGSIYEGYWKNNLKNGKVYI